ncbi:hypothetical protein AB4571_01175 [Vibrio breoganii]|uniref:hypothetical protein n=1 Tax=Vibrio breoganii TaxID=553239 RepID=UPI000C8464CE|nr:hypothetical protein [Vibrio breoganii]PML15843.1 hypothetical protein BCT84_07520 [Vibrio breoganii]
MGLFIYEIEGVNNSLHTMYALAHCDPAEHLCESLYRTAVNDMKVEDLAVRFIAANANQVRLHTSEDRHGVVYKVKIKNDWQIEVNYTQHGNTHAIEKLSASAFLNKYGTEQHKRTIVFQDLTKHNFMTAEEGLTQLAKSKQRAFDLFTKHQKASGRVALAKAKSIAWALTDISDTLTENETVALHAIQTELRESEGTLIELT